MAGDAISPSPGLRPGAPWEEVALFFTTVKFSLGQRFVIFYDRKGKKKRPPVLCDGGDGVQGEGSRRPSLPTGQNFASQRSVRFVAMFRANAKLFVTTQHQRFNF